MICSRRLVDTKTKVVSYCYPLRTSCGLSNSLFSDSMQISPLDRYCSWLTLFEHHLAYLEIPQILVLPREYLIVFRRLMVDKSPVVPSNRTTPTSLARMRSAEHLLRPVKVWSVLSICHLQGLHRRSACISGLRKEAATSLRGLLRRITVPGTVRACSVRIRRIAQTR